VDIIPKNVARGFSLSRVAEIGLGILAGLILKKTWNVMPLLKTWPLS
jgi:hypothetical protein